MNLTLIELKKCLKYGVLSKPDFIRNELALQSTLLEYVKVTRSNCFKIF